MGASSTLNAPGGAYARYVLYVLLFIYVSNQWSRYLLNYLYAVSDSSSFVSIKTATGISNAQYGLLVGYGFSLMYVVLGLFMGRAADNYNRRNIVFFGLVIWSAAVCLMGTASNFYQLLLSRIVLGIGESFSAPASYSMIADYFPIDQRGQANGVYAFGVYVGGGLGSLSIAMADNNGWRATCFVVATYGAVLAAVLLLTVREPIRYIQKKKNASTNGCEVQLTLCQALGEIFSNKLLVFLYIAGAIRFMAGYAIGSFLPLFYSEVFPEYNQIYSYLNASVVAVGGALSSYLGGRIADKWEKAGNRHARLYVCAYGSMLGIPFTLMCLLSPNFYASMLGLFFEYLTAECWFGPAISVIQNALTPRTRGVGIGAFTFICTMSGSAMSYGLGKLSDWYMKDGAHPYGMKLLLIPAVCIPYALCAAVFLYASRFVDEYSSEDERKPLVHKVDRNPNPNPNPKMAVAHAALTGTEGGRTETV